MELKEAQKRKDELETNVRMMLNDFMSLTGLSIRNIDIGVSHSIYGEPPCIMHLSIESEDLNKNAIVAVNSAKMDENTILELLNVAQVPLSKDSTLVDTLAEHGFGIYGFESIDCRCGTIKSTWTLEQDGTIIAQRAVVLNLNIKDKDNT